MGFKDFIIQRGTLSLIEGILLNHSEFFSSYNSSLEQSPEVGEISHKKFCSPFSPFPSFQNNMADGSTELDVNLEVLFSISEQESSAACYQPDEHSEKGNRPKAVDFKLTSENCFLCELEHNSPEFGPYCAVCHDFLYPNAPLVLGTETEDSHLAASCESVSSQSATCDSSETIISSGGSAESEDPEDSGCESENETKLSPEKSERPLNPSSMSLSKLPYLSLYEHVRPQNFIAERLANELSFVEEDLFGKLPPESELFCFVLRS